jgi:hypothetical protein
MPSLRQLAASAQSQNTRERIRAAIWQVAQARFGVALSAKATEQQKIQHAKVQTFARAASRFTENWIPLITVRVLQNPAVCSMFLELAADSGLLSNETEAALDAALVNAVDGVFDEFADMPN